MIFVLFILAVYIVCIIVFTLLMSLDDIKIYHEEQDHEPIKIKYKYKSLDEYKQTLKECEEKTLELKNIHDKLEKQSTDLTNEVKNKMNELDSIKQLIDEYIKKLFETNRIKN